MQTPRLACLLALGLTALSLVAFAPGAAACHDWIRGCRGFEDNMGVSHDNFSLYVMAFVAVAAVGAAFVTLRVRSQE
ncbi:MAG: hypothetical protein ABR586_00790 [Thermoplasmatota archaeon]